jgi:hypothetical protein
MIDWEIHAQEFGNCNCDYACPCQFNSLPTHGNCHAISFFHIEKGLFGDTRLDGLKMAFVVAWPGPIHEGHGTMQPIIDRCANACQRTALLSIMTGKETKGFTTVYAAMCDTILDPVYTDIRIDADQYTRIAMCEAVGVAEKRGEPIYNKATGAEHRIGIALPNGIESTYMEIGRGWSTSAGALALKIEDSYASWCKLHMNQNGVIRS